MSNVQFELPVITIFFLPEGGIQYPPYKLAGGFLIIKSPVSVLAPCGFFPSTGVCIGKLHQKFHRLWTKTFCLRRNIRSRTLEPTYQNSQLKMQLVLSPLRQKVFFQSWWNLVFYRPIHTPIWKTKFRALRWLWAIPDKKSTGHF